MTLEERPTLSFVPPPELLRAARTSDRDRPCRPAEPRPPRTNAAAERAKPLARAVPAPELTSDADAMSRAVDAICSDVPAPQSVAPVRVAVPAAARSRADSRPCWQRFLLLVGVAFASGSLTLLVVLRVP